MVNWLTLEPISYTFDLIAKTRSSAVTSGVGRILVWGAEGRGAEGVRCGEGVAGGGVWGGGCAPSPEIF